MISVWLDLGKGRSGSERRFFFVVVVIFVVGIRVRLVDGRLESSGCFLREGVLIFGGFAVGLEGIRVLSFKISVIVLILDFFFLGKL